MEENTFVWVGRWMSTISRKGGDNIVAIMTANYLSKINSASHEFGFMNINWAIPLPFAVKANQSFHCQAYSIWSLNLLAFLLILYALFLFLHKSWHSFLLSIRRRCTHLHVNYRNWQCDRYWRTSNAAYCWFCSILTLEYGIVIAFEQTAAVWRKTDMVVLIGKHFFSFQPS